MKKILFILMLISFSFALHAQKTTVAENRIARQQERLDKGVANGTVNAAEQKRIQAQIDLQKAQLATATANGKVSKAERKEIIGTQDKSSSHIKSQKTDGKNPTPRNKTKKTKTTAG